MPTKHPRLAVKAKQCPNNFWTTKNQLSKSQKNIFWHKNRQITDTNFGNFYVFVDSIAPILAYKF